MLNWPRIRLRAATRNLGAGARCWPGAAGLAVAVIVALAAIVLGGQHSAPSPPTVPSLVRRPPSPSTRVLAPAVVGRGAIAAPVHVHIGAIAHYCSGSDANLVVCRTGQRPVTPQAQRLVEVRVVARHASGPHSWYAWNLTAPVGCPQAGSGGPTRSAVRAGSNLVFDTLVPPSCRGAITALVVYVTQAPNADRERIVTVGRTRAALP